MNLRTSYQIHPPQEYDKKHLGSAGFVIGGGPSLIPYLTNSSITQWLSTQVTIGVNRAYEWFTPSYLVVGDKWFLTTYEKALRELSCLIFTPDNIQQTQWKNTISISKTARFSNEFPESLGSRIPCGNNTGVMALRLAYLLGCNPIYLLGIDLTHTEDGRTHFHSGYGENRRPTTHRLKQFANDYLTTITLLHKKKVPCFSCSPVSALNEVIPYINLENLVQERSVDAGAA